MERKNENKKSENEKIVVVTETFLQSVGSDAMTFIFICGAVWFNEKFIGGSYFLNAVLLVTFILWLFARLGSSSNIRRFKSKADAIKYLTEQAEGKTE